MGHYSDYYEQEAERKAEYKRKTLLPIKDKLKDLMLDIRRTHFLNESSSVHKRLQEALFWLEYEIP